MIDCLLYISHGIEFCWKLWDHIKLASSLIDGTCTLRLMVFIQKLVVLLILSEGRDTNTLLALLGPIAAHFDRTANY